MSSRTSLMGDAAEATSILLAHSPADEERWKEMFHCILGEMRVTAQRMDDEWNAEHDRIIANEPDLVRGPPHDELNEEPAPPTEDTFFNPFRPDEGRPF